MGTSLHQYGGRALTRQERTWPGVEVERVRWQVRKHATGLSCRREHQLFVTLGGTLRTTAWADGAERYDGTDFAGAATFIPSRRQRRASYHDGTIEYASIRLDPEVLASAEDFPGRPLELAGFTNRPDPLLHRLALALCDEIDRPGHASRLYVDSVATTLLLHLLRTGSSVRPHPSQTRRARLHGAPLHRVLDYIESHLAEDLRLDTLASVVGTGRASFARAFKATTSTTPHRYVVERRLERAARLLRSPGGPSIAEIAYQVGMSSQSHLTTAFRRAYGATPQAYRASHRSR